MGSEPLRLQMEEIESAGRPLVVLTPAVAKGIGLDFTADLLPFLPALPMFVKRHPFGSARPHARQTRTFAHQRWGLQPL